MPARRPFALASTLLMLSAAVASGQAMDVALFAPAKGGRDAAPPPLRLAEGSSLVPLAHLAPAMEAVPERVREIVDWNRAGRLPARGGLTRALAVPRAVSFPRELLSGGVVGEHAGGLVGRTADGALVWGAEVRVTGARRLRLHLDRVDLPEGTLMWVYGEGGESVGPFGLELRSPDGGLWTPSVAGEVIRFEIRLPAREAAVPGFLIDQVAEVLDPWQTGSAPGLALRAGECLVDAQCIDDATFNGIDFVQQAIGAYEFIDGIFIGYCSGGLLNSTSGAPFFLTANHCLASQGVASTVEVFWDYYTDSCNGTAPAMGSLPRSNGSTLLATATSSDYTLLLLDSIPSNRILLGWNPNQVPDDTVLHRVSLPCDPNVSMACDRVPQSYSRNHVDESAQICQSGGDPVDRPEFIYETFFPTLGDMGGTFGGSSGAPVIQLGPDPLDIWAVGQLTGGCPQGPGSDPFDGCDYTNAEVDGAFFSSYDVLSGFLLGGCVPSETTLCLRDGRFQVEVEWRTNQGTLRDANVVQGVQSGDSGLFYFLEPDNWEFLVKVLDGCNITNHYWVFSAATTNVEYTLTVTDTQNPSVPPAVYTKEAGPPAPAITDTSAFATCP